MPILNYRTTVDHNKTVHEIQTILSKKGANRIVTDYSNGVPTAISFQVAHNGQTLSFILPANFRAVKKCLEKQKVAKSFMTEAHAIKVCWRILKDWIEAQMAIIESEQADIATVFLPYAVMKNGETVSKNLLGEKGKEFLLIE